MSTPESQKSNLQGLTVGRNAKRIREAQGLSMEFVAKQIGLTVAEYSSIETDAFGISEHQLTQLSVALGVSVPDLLSEPGPEANSDQDHPNNVSTGGSNLEIQRLEQLYQEQIDLLRDEVNYLRNMLASVSKKDWFRSLIKTALLLACALESWW